jgi:3-isopropylmalate/(R)-2-methylmalate dehydratase large subunit
MTGRTLSEKILSAHAGHDARAGDIVVCAVDWALGTDASMPMALDYFEAMGGRQVHAPERVVVAFDHYAPAPSPGTAALHQRLRDFARRTGIVVHEVGEGIGHQLMVETGRARPGVLLVGADSHAVTAGALGAFATGIGSSDLAAVMMCGRLWLRVPGSIRVVLEGALPPGVFAKDVALALARELRADGASYQTLEFAGPGAASLDLEDRLVLANMSVELGAKAGLFAADDKTASYLQGRGTGPIEPLMPDPDAAYTRELVLDLSRLEPQIALPHQVDNVAAARESAGTPVHMVFLGTCTGGRARDFHQAYAVLAAGGGPAPGVQLVVTPASREVHLQLLRDGTLAGLVAMGAVVTTPGCGSCCGTCGSIPGDGVTVISTANRNFKARMGNPAASIYLASPATCAAAALRGAIVDPRAGDR